MMNWLANLPNPPNSVFLNLPSQSSYDLPTVVPGTYMANAFDFDFPLFKFGQIMPRHILPLAISRLYTDEVVRPEFQGEYLTSYDLIFLYGYGIEGIREVSHWSDNTAAFYPHSKTNSKFHEHSELVLPEDYKAFMEQFETVVLIAFGTTFMPSEEDMMKLFEAVKLDD